MNCYRMFCFLMLVVMSLRTMAHNRDSDYLHARRYGAKTRIVLCALGDCGSPIVADVRVRMGMNFAEKSYEINGVTDTNGCFVIEGITTGNEVEITLTKTGYYSSTRRLCYVKMGDERNVKDGCWQPWGMEECMVIRKIEDPINIRNFCGFIDAPATNRWIGLDLKEGCWVKPYGKGLVADIEVLVAWDGLPKPLSKTCMVRVRSVGNDGGCFFQKIKDSAFPNVKKASPCTVYEPILFDCVERVNGVRMQEGSRWETQSLVMRTRCVKDDVMGRIVTCNYLNLYKLKVSPSRRGTAVLNIEYVFNSKPNDNNLEDVRISQMQEEQFKHYHHSYYQSVRETIPCVSR